VWVIVARFAGRVLSTGERTIPAKPPTLRRDA